MLPYRAPEIKAKSIKPQKLKSLPSLEFINNLNTVCDESTNTYDQKNHVLMIKDVEMFQMALRQKLNRSLKSMDRQLKILGFKLHQYRSNMNENESQIAISNQIRVYKWKGKKQLLIDEQLSHIEKLLKERKGQIEKSKESIRLSKLELDKQIESIMFTMLINFNPQKIKDSLTKLIQNTKQSVNQSQLTNRKIVNQISTTLSHQLELYKLLIYKQVSSEKKNQWKEQGWGENEENQQGNQNEQQENSENNGVIQQEQESKNSLVSIQMEKNVRSQLQ